MCGGGGCYIGKKHLNEDINFTVALYSSKK